MLENLQRLTYDFWVKSKSSPSESFKYSPHISFQDLQNRIEILVLNIIDQILTTGSIQLSHLNPTQSAQFDQHSNMNRVSQLKTTALRLCRSKESISHLLKVIQLVYSLSLSNQKATKREVYYMSTELFKSQQKSDKAIEAASNILEVPRNRLNIISTSKGLMAGNFSYTENFTETFVGNRVLKIPQVIEEISLITSADYILVVEKDTILNKLIQEGFFDENNCIGITGCGYPDMQTRELIKRIVVEYSHLPVFVLTDYDPHGFKILCTYTFGSLNLATECDSLAIPFAHWLGCHFGETSQPLPLTFRDFRLIDKILTLDQLNLSPKDYQSKRFRFWKMQIEEMMENNVKFEVESIPVARISEYIQEKIENGGWI